jgi:uncharacterized protein (TIGR02246 family)
MSDTISDEARIRELIQHWAEAARAKDMDGALANHTDDIMLFDVPKPLFVKGIDEYKKAWELFFENSFIGPGSFEVTELQITTGETVAFAHGLLHIGGSQEPVGRLTLGLRNVRGDWLIAHEHHSYPLDLDQDR